MNSFGLQGLSDKEIALVEEFGLPDAVRVMEISDRVKRWGEWVDISEKINVRREWAAGTD